jgi:hypothetical protein
MSEARPSRGVGRLKEGKAGIVKRLPVTSSSSPILSGKLGMFLVAPANKMSNARHKTIERPHMCGKIYEIRHHLGCVSTPAACVAPGEPIGD